MRTNGHIKQKSAFGAFLLEFHTGLSNSCRKLVSEDEFRADLLVIVHALDHIGKQVGYRKYGEFRQVLALLQRYGIGHDHFRQRALVDPVVSRTRKHGMSHGSADASRAHLHEHIGGLGDRARRVDHVVHDDDIAVLHIADRRDLAHDVGFLALLVADNHRSVQVLRIGMGTLGSAHVGRGDRQILHLQILHIGNENAARIQMNQPF